MQRLRAICVGFSLLLTQAAMAQSAVVDEQVTVDFVRAYMQKHGGCAVFSPNWHAQFNLAAPFGKPLRDWTASDVRLFERYGLACIDREEARRTVPDPSWRQALQRQFRDRNEGLPRLIADARAKYEQAKREREEAEWRRAAETSRRESAARAAADAARVTKLCFSDLCLGDGLQALARVQLLPAEQYDCRDWLSVRAQQDISARGMRSAIVDFLSPKLPELSKDQVSRIVNCDDFVVTSENLPVWEKISQPCVALAPAGLYQSPSGWLTRFRMRPRANDDRLELAVISIERVYRGIVAEDQRQDLLKTFADSVGISFKRSRNFDFGPTATFGFQGLGFINYGWQNENFYAIAGPLTRGNATEEGTLVIGIAQKGVSRQDGAAAADRFCRAEKLKVD